MFEMAGTMGAAHAAHASSAKAGSLDFLFPPSTHYQGHPDAHHVAKIKTALMEHVDSGDQIGVDANGDECYAGKSLEPLKGGRWAMMHDKLTLEFVERGYSHEEASQTADRICAKNFHAKYPNGV
jgi:hypothetical protein